MFLGNCQKNKWCCFCRHWYDPTNSALTPRMGKDLFDVDGRAVKKCNLHCLETHALGTCKDFKKKF
jgi:hypothetical protein